MSQVINWSDTAANAQALAVAPLCNSGLINLYSGPQPANANTAIGGSNTLLATLTFGSTAFGAPAAGVLTANAITPGTAVASGTATFARIFESNGTTVVGDVQVQVGSGGGINLNNANIVSGNPVSISALTLTITET